MSKRHTIDTQNEKLVGSPTSATTPNSRKPTFDKTGFRIDPWLCDEPIRSDLPMNGDPWESCLQKVKEFDADICEGWRDEVDKLLIFAGLFFSAVTAFVIESYQFLQADPQDQVTFLLEQILLETRNANAGLPVVAPVPQPPPFVPSASTIRINVLWFLSLSLSLGTVLLGILCLQWLREYQRNIPLDPKQALALRQMRYDGLVAWKVPEMLTSLPVLLNASLLLFFWGLLELVWSLNETVAIATTIIVGIFSLIVTFTTVVPAIQLFWIKDKHLRVDQCPWKSPQSWTVHRLVMKLLIIVGFKKRLARPGFRTQRYEPFVKDNNWFDYDENWLKARQNATQDASAKPSDIVRALVWADYQLGSTFETISSIYHCLRSLRPLSLTLDVLRRIQERISLHINQQGVQGRLSDKATPGVLAALYLEENNVAFPQLDVCRFETIIRVLNTQLATLDRDSATSPNSARPLSPLTPEGTAGSTPPGQLMLPFNRWPVPVVRHLPLDLVVQSLQCIDLIIHRRLCPPKIIDDIASFVGTVCSRLLELFEEPSVPDEAWILKELTAEIVKEFPKEYSSTLLFLPEWDRTKRLEERAVRAAEVASSLRHL